MSTEPLAHVPNDPIVLAVALTIGHPLDVRRAVFAIQDIRLLDDAASLIAPQDGDERLLGWLAARRAVLAALETTRRVTLGLEEPTALRLPRPKDVAKAVKAAPRVLVGHQQRLLGL